MTREYPNGLTVAELKALVADMPEIDEQSGEPYEVWVGTGNGNSLSSPCVMVATLNAGDLLLEVRME